MATPKRLCLARRTAGSSAGRDWLLSPAFVEQAAELLSARELAALARTARSHLRIAGDVVGAAVTRRRVQTEAAFSLVDASARP